MDLFMFFNELGRGVIVRFVDIGGIELYFHKLLLLRRSL